MVIRYLTYDDDMMQVSSVYEQSWKHAYKGIIPQSYLDGIPEGRWAKSVSVYLLPEYTGNGYGRKLVEKAIFELKKLGYKKIILWVLEENMNARQFYEHLGFVNSGEVLDDNIGGKDVREIAYINNAS